MNGRSSIRTIPQTRHALAAAALVAGPLVFLVAEAVSAAAWHTPPYSYAFNWISDLGADTVGPLQGRVVDSPLHTVMNVGFIGSGVLLALAILLLPPSLTGSRWTTAVWIGGAASVGYALLGLFHSSPAASQDGTLALHYTGATLSILGLNGLAILLGRRWSTNPRTRGLGHISIALGAFGLVAVVVLFATTGSGAPSGLIERLAVYPALIWQLRIAAHLLRARSVADTAHDRLSRATLPTRKEQS